MSNSIWKTGDPVYRDNRFDEIIVREYKRWAADGVFYIVDDYCSELPNRWAYLLDIIAQADKAERLQKAVDKALDALDYVSNEKFTTEDGDFFEEYEEMHKAIKQDIDEIKQLIKE